MKILYVGGVWPVELSLFKESHSNPNISVKFCNDGGALPGAFDSCGCTRVLDRPGIEQLKAEYAPDLTIFRTWNVTEILANKGDVLWAQEISASESLEQAQKDEGVFSPHGCSIAYQSTARAQRFGGYWLPYCVSRYWGKQNATKTIPVMVATSLPPSGTDLKKKSLDILVRPLVDKMPSELWAFNGYHRGLESLDYLKPCLKASFNPMDAVHHISRAKIYISPSTIWFDEGCISYKTVEAMACGVLTVTNNYIGMEDVFGKDGENLIYANTPEETVEKVQYYLSHDKEREEIAERGYEFVHENYGWERNLIRLKEEIDEQQAL